MPRPNARNAAFIMMLFITGARRELMSPMVNIAHHCVVRENCGGSREFFTTNHVDMWRCSDLRDAETR